jgi:hypothetical protein
VQRTSYTTDDEGGGVISAAINSLTGAAGSDEEAVAQLIAEYANFKPGKDIKQVLR